MLDERLLLAAALYEPCALGADIGTDHALLPCHLLHQRICERMLLIDISPKALSHARGNIERHHLEARAQLFLSDGLDEICEPCGCVSIMGMGGETIRNIILRGQHKLSGAVVVVSAHTEQPLVRQTFEDIGYHITQEPLCYADGRFYIFWRAEPGQESPWQDESIQYGKLLWQQNNADLLIAYCRFRMKVMTARLSGLKSASGDVEALRASITADLTYYQRKIDALEGNA